VRCLKLGASGYLNKSADTDQLLEAIRKAANGGVFVTTAQAEALAVSLSARSDLQPHEILSDREYQVLRLIATGQSVAQIAAQLSLSPNTVSTYRARICEKTGTRNDVEIALYAVRQGLHQA
jgi:DNA-binding NarL/FixJ family response regulator